ncbi:MAG: YdcH family protein [Roseobacter sp.]
MSVSAHVEQLKKKHESLSEEVEAAQRAPGMDDLTVADLKKQKLRLKEEIFRLSS